MLIRKYVVVALTLVTALSAVYPAAADDDPQNSDWLINDDPRLLGPTASWWQEASGGYWGDYHYTYGIGKGNQRDNWAVWNMGHRHGRQTIHVWVPQQPADVKATVLYRVYKNSTLVDTVRVDQHQTKGWVRLGSWNFNGADVHVEVWDNETLEHYDRNDLADSRIGIDAAAMRCWANCSNDTEQNDTEQEDDKGDTGTGYSIDKYIQAVNELPGRGDLCKQSASTHPHNTGRKWLHADPWNMFVGECTSWVAFRLNEAGIPFHNWAGGARWGHAINWDNRASIWNSNASRSAGFHVQLVDTPVVGAVAQWNWSTHGHVAYVEEVHDDGDTIVVSEMNYGNFRNGTRLEWCKLGTRTITRTDSGWKRWPDSFIAFRSG